MHAICALLLKAFDKSEKKSLWDSRRMIFITSKKKKEKTDFHYFNLLLMKDYSYRSSFESTNPLF